MASRLARYGAPVLADGNVGKLVTEKPLDEPTVPFRLTACTGKTSNESVTSPGNAPTDDPHREICRFVAVPGFTVMEELKPLIRKGGSAFAVSILKDALPVFVTVSVCEALMLPWATLPKFIAEALSDAIALVLVPVPASGTICGLTPWMLRVN